MQPIKMFVVKTGCALNPKTGKKLWEGSKIGSIKWQSPFFVNGVLYITNERR